MKTNSKQVKKAMQEHVISFFEADNPDATQALTDQTKSMISRQLPRLYAVGKHMAEGGSFLVYYGEVIDFLNSLGINPENKEYPVDKSWALYCHLCGLAVEQVVLEWPAK